MSIHLVLGLILAATAQASPNPGACWICSLAMPCFALVPNHALYRPAGKTVEGAWVISEKRVRRMPMDPQISGELLDARMGNLYWLAVSADGREVYAAGSKSNRVAVFERDVWTEQLYLSNLRHFRSRFDRDAFMASQTFEVTRVFPMQRF